jgi:hypothetical protein
MKKQIKDLSLHEIDFLVAKAERFNHILKDENKKECFIRDNYYRNWVIYSPTTNPSQAWPIIEREKINLKYLDVMKKWLADIEDDEVCGNTSLEAAMRAYVVEKFGYDVEL